MYNKMSEKEGFTRGRAAVFYKYFFRMFPIAADGVSDLIKQAGRVCQSTPLCTLYY
mgnify:CR=1 FL=1